MFSVHLNVLFIPCSVHPYVLFTLMSCSPPVLSPRPPPFHLHSWHHKLQVSHNIMDWCKHKYKYSNGQAQAPVHTMLQHSTLYTCTIMDNLRINTWGQHIQFFLQLVLSTSCLIVSKLFDMTFKQPVLSTLVNLFSQQIVSTHSVNELCQSLTKETSYLRLADNK